jgi:hypothetical protein
VYVTPILIWAAAPTPPAPVCTYQTIHALTGQINNALAIEPLGERISEGTRIVEDLRTNCIGKRIPAAAIETLARFLDKPEFAYPVASLIYDSGYSSAAVSKRIHDARLNLARSKRSAGERGDIVMGGDFALERALQCLDGLKHKKRRPLVCSGLEHQARQRKDREEEAVTSATVKK